MNNRNISTKSPCWPDLSDNAFCILSKNAFLAEFLQKCMSPYKQQQDVAIIALKKDHISCAFYPIFIITQDRSLNYVLTLQVGLRSQLTFGQLQFLPPVILTQNRHRQQNPHSLECRIITILSFKAIVKTT